MTGPTVVKVGGSLLESGCLPALLETLADLAGAHPLAVVPGGGPFADAVREWCRRNDPGASAAHWMAILAMDQHAHLMAGFLPSARLAVGPEEIAAAQAERRLPVLAPYRWLRAEDPLPHGWHVTSDSIAAWVAGRLGASRLVLLKALDGVPGPGDEVLAEAPRDAAAGAGIVDAHFERAAAAGLECWVLNGRDPRRLSALLREGRAPGTRLV
jgi:aspartokinase-like uncharacterized kinase